MSLEMSQISPVESLKKPTQSLSLQGAAVAGKVVEADPAVPVPVPAQGVPVLVRVVVVNPFPIRGNKFDA